MGPSLLSAFDADPHFSVSVLARQSSKSTFPPHIKVHRVGDGYPDAELVEAFQGQDAVISSIARASMERQKAIIDAAVKAGVKRFVPSDFGGDLHNVKAAALLPQYFEGKLETRKYLKEKEKDGLTWTSFATGPFFEMYVNWNTQRLFVFSEAYPYCVANSIPQVHSVGVLRLRLERTQSHVSW